MGSTLSFEIAGNITSIRVEEGDRVSKGQLLATINPTTVKEAHRATLTTLKQAQDAYRRFRPLHQSGTISDMKWVEIESKLEQAKAAESIARQQLSHSTSQLLLQVSSLQERGLGNLRAPRTACAETCQCGTSQRQGIRTRS